MSGVVHALFGGGSDKSQQTSSSSNKAWDVLSNPLTPVVQGGANSFNTLNDTLGKGFDDYKKNAGFDFQLNRGQQGITGSAAARGLLNSGSTAKSLATFETGLGSQMYNNYLDRLKGVADLGISGGGGVLAASGATSTGQATGNKQDYGKGILGTLFG